MKFQNVEGVEEKDKENKPEKQLSGEGRCRV